MIFGTQGGVQSENSDKLEFADLLNEKCYVFEVLGVPKWSEILAPRAEILAPRP